MLDIKAIKNTIDSQLGSVQQKFTIPYFQDTSKKAVLKQIEFADSYQEEEIISMALKDVGLI